MSSEAANAKASAKLTSTQAPVRVPNPVSDPEETASHVPLSREQRLAAALEDIIHIQELGDPHVYLFRGSCKKCGWQTHQMDQEHARQLCRMHVQQHWKDAAMIAQNT